MSREVDENRKKYNFEMEKNLFLCQKNFLDVEKTCSGYVKHSPSSSEQARKKLRSYDTSIKRFVRERDPHVKKKPILNNFPLYHCR